MVTKKTESRNAGFSLIGILLILVAIGLVVFIGWRVWDGMRDKTVGQGGSNSQPTSNSQFQLLSGHVTLTLQNGWSASGVHKSTDCMRTLESTITCLDQSSAYTDAAGKVDGAPAYSVDVAVYKHDDNATAKEWWENDFKGDNGTTVVSGNILNASTAPIAGHDAYSFTLDRGNGSGEVNYIITTKNYAILIKASAEGNTPTNVPVGNFLPAIQGMANSTKVQ